MQIEIGHSRVPSPDSRLHHGHRTSAVEQLPVTSRNKKFPPKRAFASTVYYAAITLESYKMSEKIALRTPSEMKPEQGQEETAQTCPNPVCQVDITLLPHNSRDSLISTGKLQSVAPCLPRRLQVNPICWFLILTAATTMETVTGYAFETIP